MIEIRQVSVDDVFPLRQEVLWPDKPLSYVKIDNDDEGIHFGLYVDDLLVTVISIFIENGQAQFRKFATLESYRGCGYGSRIFKHMLAYLSDQSVQRVWCNARLEASDFYRRFGFKEKAIEIFYKGDVAYTIMEKNMT